jgi:glutathione synthase/RimK-type ligase-like ATP-grasp enzyme
LIPTIDEELPLFGDAIDAISEQGVTVFSSVRRTAEQCNDKFVTSDVLRAHGVPAAVSHLPDMLPAEPVLPLFVKPRLGRGSVAAFAVQNARELAFFLEYVDDPIVQEYLDGPEYTIDLLCDLGGHPISIGLDGSPSGRPITIIRNSGNRRAITSGTFEPPPVVDVEPVPVVPVDPSVDVWLVSSEVRNTPNS